LVSVKLIWDISLSVRSGAVATKAG